MTVITMNKGGADQGGERRPGERRLGERRRKFWKLVAWGLLLGLGIGMAMSIVVGFSHAHEQAGGEWIGWAMWPVLLLSAWAFIRYTVAYFRRIDELDLLDNLWSSLIGLYAVLAGYPIWQVLHQVRQLPEPNAHGMWLIAMASTVAAYGWRKLRHRF